MHPSTIAVTSVLVVAGLAACAPPDPPLRASSEHVDLHIDIEPPEGLIEWLDHAVVSYAEMLGVDDPHVTVVVHDTADDVRAVCRRSSDWEIVGCADGAKVYQNITYYPHELVHAVASRIGRPPAVLQEGLAEAIGCGPDSGFDQRVTPDRALLGWLDDDDRFFAGSEDSARARYPIAASFVRFVIQRHGLDALLYVYRALPKDAGGGRVNARFEEATGEPIEQLVDAWVAEGPRPWGSICEAVPECRLAPAQPVMDVELIAGLERIRFPNFAAAPTAYAGVLDVAETTDLQLSLTVPDGSAWRSGTARVIPCFGSELRTGIVAFFGEGQSTASGVTRLMPGRYAIAAHVSPRDGVLDDATLARVSVDARPSSTLACSPQSIAVPDDVPFVRLAPDLDARLEAAEHRYQVEPREGLRIGVGVAGVAEAAARCSEICTTECEELASAEPMIPLDTPVVLRLTDVAGPDEILQGTLRIAR
ncbi:hypothetical protein [Sandaracinus amylolyticus]|uniref:hypothetical protein n=1 Tax=Sandaracinus amylolyticus TaxID=927083 RepID=UPI001F388F62|nr:hypothetical protein [Sandaracinus amylolyticus]UJR79188.1 Hypothetical protein I5071_12210 [Sandaracinus amylolyticus]